MSVPLVLLLQLHEHRYPGQEHVAGSPKIPTIMYYDSSGRMRSAGAETALPETTETAEEEEWLKVEWYDEHFNMRIQLAKSLVVHYEGSSFASGRSTCHRS